MNKQLIEFAGCSDDLLAFTKQKADCFEIVYLHTGTLRLQIKHKHYTVQSPALILLNELDDCVLQPVGDTCLRYYLCISLEAASNRIRDEELGAVLHKRHPNACPVIPAGPFQNELMRIFSASVEEYKRKLVYSDQRQMALLIDLLVLLCREMSHNRSEINRNSISNIREIQSRIENSYFEKISISALAAEYYMSVSYLSHLFKRTTGYAVIEYLTKCRLSQAKKLLLNTQMSITEIAYATGFLDSSNFSRLFKKKYGLSPTEFRKSLAMDGDKYQ